MPIYEYRCKNCGQQLEIIQKVGESPRRKCDKCGGRLEKLISRTAFVLKGGGWYAEGYSRGGGSGSKSDKKDSKKDSSSTSGGETKKASSGTDGPGGKQSVAAN